MGSFFQDLRYGTRMLAKTPGFTLAALLALAIGIGANTAIFSVVYSVMLKPLPYHDSQRLVLITEKDPHMQMSVAYPDFLDWRQRSQSFESMAAYRRESFNMPGTPMPERVQARMVSWNFFRTFGSDVSLGRDFSQTDDQTSATPTAILTYGFWQRRFGGDRNIIGQPITLSDKKFTVVGIAPLSFKYGDGIDLFVPIELGRTANWTRGNHPGIYVVGRLKPGVTLEQARAEMDTVANAINLENSQDGVRNVTAGIRPMLESFIEEVKQPLLIMFFAVGFMLLIACTNVANLLLARSTVRQRELAIRNAMGASRARMFRQLLTESVMLSVIGGICGVLIAYWGVSGLRGAQISSLPRVEEIAVAPKVLVFTAAISVLVGILFGMFPALQASKANVNDLLKDSGARGGGRTQGRFRNLLVAAELALALVMLVGAGLAAKSLNQLLRVDTGFEPNHLVLFQMTLSPERNKGESAVQFLQQIQRKVAELPGVSSVAFANGGPMVGASETSVYHADADMRDPASLHMTVEYFTSPEYQQTMGIRLLKGRYFNSLDQKDSPKVTVVDTEFAKEFFGDQDPIGKRVKNGDPKEPSIYEVVGVVQHVKHYGLDNAGPVKSQFYLAAQQANPKYPIMGRSYVMVRTSGDESAFKTAFGAKVAEVDPNQPVFNVTPYRTVIEQVTETQRLTSWLLGGFAAIALLLASIGIYSVMSYTVTQRTHEIGIRMALGARREDVLRMVLTQSVQVTLIGLLVGAVSGLVLTRYMKALLFNVRPTDPVVFASIALTLGVVAILASYIPARRATKVDPMIALRYE